MATADLAAPPFDVAAFAARLGVAASRIVRHPAPGTATEDDFIHANEAGRGPLCELVDGVLVEKVMGAPESQLNLYLGSLLYAYVVEHDLGEMLGADGMQRTVAGRYREPDLSFMTHETLARRTNPAAPIQEVVCDLAVEVLSPTNTRREMAEKRAEYFAAGCRLVWEVDPDARTITVYTSPTAVTELTEADTLTGGDVLPGFSLPVARVFARHPRS